MHSGWQPEGLGADHNYRAIFKFMPVDLYIENKKNGFIQLV